MSNQVIPFRKPIKDSVVSEGTLRTPDLLEAFHDELRVLSMVPTDLLFEAKCWLEGPESYAENIDHSDYYEAGEEIMNELAQELETRAPDGYYFGPLVGDGACFGFWSMHEEAV